MTDRLRIPDLFAGDFEHCIICTYSTHLEFFEQDLLRQLRNVRNRIVLADSTRLADAFADSAAGATFLRHVNVNYLAAPIRSPGTAHAKFVLLGGPESGLLLVGSGNLTYDGYTSQGELFCCYRHTTGQPQHLPAFTAIHDFVEGLVHRNYLDPIAIDHVQHAWDGMPWLYGPAANKMTPVRHNLEVTLLEQFADEIGAAAVHELTVHAPFFDPKCEALAAVIKRLRPRSFRLLVQDGQTSIDPHALQGLLSSISATYRIEAISAPYDGTYIHAKLLLARLSDRTVILQGSPNLSRAALCLHDPSGNLEVANLISAPVDADRDILGGLKLRPIRNLNQVKLSHRPIVPEAVDAIRLVQATLGNAILRIQASVALPPPESIVILVAGEAMEVKPTLVAPDTVEVCLDPAQEIALAHVFPIALRLTIAGKVIDTRPIFPYRLEALESLLSERRDPELLRRAGGLDLPDEDLMALLDELDAALLIDTESLWRVVKRVVPDAVVDGPSMSWEDIDWERVRMHPRIAQYRAAGSRSDATSATDLQVILTAITDHFRGLDDRLARDVDPRHVILVSDSTPTESEEELVALQKAREKQHRSQASRNRSAWRRFVSRFLKGLEDRRLQEVLGPVGVTANAVIFNHLLALLIARDVIDAEFGIGSQVRLWRWLWGSGASATPALFLNTDPEELAEQEAMFLSRGGISTTLRAIGRAARVTLELDWEQSQADLRNVVRVFMVWAQQRIVVEDLYAAIRPPEGIGSVRELIEPIERLAERFSEEEVKTAVALALNVDSSYVGFEHAIVHRADVEESVEYIQIDATGFTLTPSIASAALTAWQSLETDLGYYRLQDSQASTVAVIDTTTGDRWWADKTSGKMVDLPSVEIELAPWQVACRFVSGLAQTTLIGELSA